MITAVITINATSIDAVVYKDDARVGAIHTEMERVLVIETSLRPLIETCNAVTVIDYRESPRRRTLLAHDPNYSAVWVAMEEVDNKICSIAFPNANDAPWGVVADIIYRRLDDIQRSEEEEL